MRVKKITTPFYEKLSLVLIGLIALVYLIIIGKEILDPLAFGFLFAILLLPAANFFEKKLRFPRSMAALVSIILFIAFVAAILYLVGSQIAKLADDWPMLRKQVSETIDNLSKYISSAFHINLYKQLGYVHDATTKLMASGTDVIGTTFGALSSILLFYSFIITFTFLILLYRRILLQFLLSVFKEEHSIVVLDIVENVQNILRKYILGLLLEMFIVACIACTAFWIIGIKYAVLLGVIVGIFNIIPYIGIFTALLLSSVITFAAGSIADALKVAGSVLVIHAIDSNLLLPVIVGKKVQLNALLSFLGIVIGEMIWGLSGMFLSIPTMAIMKIVFDRIEDLKPWGFLLGNGDEEKKLAIEEVQANEE